MVARIIPKGGKPLRPFFREWRKFRNMTQEQVAEALDTTKATVSRMETGKTQYNADYLQAIANLFKVREPDLFYDPVAPDKSFDHQLSFLEPDVSELVRDHFDAVLKREIEKKRSRNQ